MGTELYRESSSSPKPQRFSVKKTNKLNIMKTLFIIVFSLLTQLTFAQCDKDFLLNFNEITEIRGTTNSPMKTEGTINFSKDQIVIKAKVNGGEKVITSQVRNADCKWDAFL